MSSYGDPSLETTILNSTNTYRLQHNASTVTWNSTLADFAQAYAQTCKWEHSDSPYGENLAAGYSSPGRAIDGWYRESSMYSYRQSSFSEQTGHFTQLVWQRTDAVGCGAARCNNNDIKGWFLVCEYYPPGNVIGAFAGNVSAPRSQGDIPGSLGGAGNAGSVTRAFSKLSLLCLVAMSVLLSTRL